MKNIPALILLVILGLGCSQEEANDPAPTELVSPSEVEVLKIVGVGKVEPENEIVSLAATSGGVIVEVFKNDGEVVLAGEPLVKLDDDLEQINIRQIRSQIKTQGTQVVIEQSNLKEAEIQLKNKKKLLVSTQSLMDKGAETQQVLDDLETEVASQEIGIEKYKASVLLARNKLDELREDLKKAEIEADKKVLRSPYPGTVLDMQVNKGSALNQFATYAKFAQEGSNIVRAEVDELFCEKLKVGQAVEIRMIGTDKVIAKGEVAMLSPYLKPKSLFSEKANDQEDRRVRQIEITLKDDPDLIINTRVECIILL